LVLLLYHTVLSDSIAAQRGAANDTEDDWTKLVGEILTKRIIEYPNSPIYLYYQARLSVILGKVSEAADILERTLAMRSALEWPQLLQACAWELLTVSMFRLEWKRCHELATMLSEESRWSLCFSLFLEAIFLHSAYYVDDPQPETRDKIFKLLEKVPQQMKRIAGRRLPIEKYATYRAEEALESGELPFYPEYELLLVWDGYSRMSDASLQKVLIVLDEAEKGGVRADQQIMILLIRAAVLRAQSRLDEAVELLTKVLQKAEKLPKDAYAIPIAQIEWAQIGLVKRDVGMARAHYEASTSYSHRYILQRSAQLRHAKIKAGLARLSGEN
jgi:tetratricopeptide (TPR) repeat protein